MPGPKADDLDRIIGLNLRIRRNEVGLTLSMVADAVGFSYQSVQKMEKGETKISATCLHHLAKTLDVPISYFFVGTAQPDDVKQFSFSREAKEAIQGLSQIRDTRVRRDLIRLIQSIAKEG